MSDTPRTDSMEPYGPPYDADPLVHVPKTFARQLERENQALRAEVAALKKALFEAQNAAIELSKTGGRE